MESKIDKDLYVNAKKLCYIIENLPSYKGQPGSPERAYQLISKEHVLKAIEMLLEIK